MLPTADTESFRIAERQGCKQSRLRASSFPQIGALSSAGCLSDRLGGVLLQSGPTVDGQNLFRAT